MTDVDETGRRALMKSALLMSASSVGCQSLHSSTSIKQLSNSLLNAADRAQSYLAKLLDPIPPTQRKAISADLMGRFASFHGQSPDEKVGRTLEVLRALSSSGVELEPAPLLAGLSARSVLYAGRPKPEIGRLRSFLVLTVAHVGLGPRIVGLVMDLASNSVTPMELASGLRAARLIRKPLPGFVEILHQYLRGIPNDTILSLDRYTQEFPPAEATSAQLEVIRAIARYGPRAAELSFELEALIGRLRDVRLAQPLPVLEEAVHALETVRGKP